MLVTGSNSRALAQRRARSGELAVVPVGLHSQYYHPVSARRAICRYQASCWAVAHSWLFHFQRSGTVGRSLHYEHNERRSSISPGLGEQPFRGFGPGGEEACWAGEVLYAKGPVGEYPVYWAGAQQRYARGGAPDGEDGSGLAA